MESLSREVDDEINVIDLFKKFKKILVDNRLSVIKTCLIVALVLSLTILGLFLKSPPEFAYSQTIAFTFPQAEKNQYPNGAPFSINDLLSREILREVYNKNQLDKIGVDFDEFIGSFSIVYHSVTEPFINTKYQTMLARKNITTAEISTLERDFKSEIDATSKKNVRITMLAPFSSPISGRLANKVLADVAVEWSHQAVNKLGVLNIPNTGFDRINSQFVDANSPFQVLDYFGKFYNNLRISLDSIAKFPGGDTLVDPVTGDGIDSLKQQLDYLNRYWIIAFDYYTQQHNKTDDVDIKSAELSLNELNRKKLTFINNSNIYKSALKDFDESTSRAKPLDIIKNDNTKDHSQQLQFEGDSLQKLIELGSQNKDSEFRQELTRLSITNELSSIALDSEIMTLEQRIQAAKKSFNKDDIDLIKVNLYKNEIVKRLTDLSSSIQRIEDIQTAKFKDARGVLYTDGVISKSLASSLVSIFYLPFSFICISLLIVLIVMIITGRKPSF